MSYLGGTTEAPFERVWQHWYWILWTVSSVQLAKQEQGRENIDVKPIETVPRDSTWTISFECEKLCAGDIWKPRYETFVSVSLKPTDLLFAPCFLPAFAPLLSIFSIPFSSSVSQGLSPLGLRSWLLFLGTGTSWWHRGFCTLRRRRRRNPTPLSKSFWRTSKVFTERQKTWWCRYMNEAYMTLRFRPTNIFFICSEVDTIKHLAPVVFCRKEIWEWYEPARWRAAME